tara:strand:+ start:9119 stop:12823 length:3705 start_codon:yes stop_codon:yes gene_type:complete
MPANNQRYLEASGTFSGTVDTTFEVEYVYDATNGPLLKWRTKADGTWSSKTSITSANWDVDVAESLTLGMSITLTRDYKGQYNYGDKWTFTMYATLQITPEITTGFDTLEIIERSDKKDLVAISSETGRVALVKDFEGESPQVVGNDINIGVNPDIDTCSRNKELYIASGKDRTPRFIGYTKNLGFDGVGTEFKFIEDAAYEQVDSQSFDAKALNDFVVLRGNNSTQGGSNIIVGIMYESNKLYVWNKDTSKVYIFNLGGQAIRIRPDVSKYEVVSSQNVTNGVCILTESQSNDMNTLEFWSIPFDGSNVGQGANFDRRVDLAKPNGNLNITSFSDFLIVSSLNDFTSAAADFDLIIAPRMEVRTEINNTCLFKVNDIDGTIASVSGNNYINITPTLDYSNESSGSVNQFCTRRQTIDFEWSGWSNGTNGSYPQDSNRVVTGTSYSTQDSSKAHIDLVQDISLAFSGYDGSGENPMIHFTARIAKDTDYNMSGHTTKWTGDYSNFNYANLELHQDFGPFWKDSASKIYAVRWITFSLAVSSTGPTKCAKLLHLHDRTAAGPFNNAYLEGTHMDDSYVSLPALVDNYSFPPHRKPNYAKSELGRGGKKVNFIGDISENGNRWGLTYHYDSTIDNSYSKVYTFMASYITGGSHLWEDEGIWIYPSTSTAPYAACTLGDMSSEVRPEMASTRLISTTNVDCRRWNLGDHDYALSIKTTAPWFPISAHKLIAMQSVRAGFIGSVSRISKFKIDQTYNTNESNILSGSSGWISFGAVTEDTSEQWEGGATKKAFYRVSLVYDGYQESTLLDLTAEYADPNDAVFTKSLEFTITVQADWIPPDRVASIVVYRADDPLKLAVSPSGLYRFIEEVSLVSFSTNSGGNYSYTIRDTGSSQGSYGAVNGIAETLTNLHMKYTTCASANGYMFIGNCDHVKFDSAENYIFRSQPGKFSIFDWSKDFSQLDFIPRAMAGFMGKLYVFGNSKTAIINPETLVVEDEINGVGCIGPKAIQNTPTGLYWFDKNNIYSANPQIRKIGTPILKQDSFGWHILSDAEKESAVSGYDSNRHCYLIYFTKSSLNRVWSHYITTNRWDLWETDYTVYDTVQASDGHPILLMDNGRISKHLGGANKRDWEYESKKFSLGTGTTVRKKIKSIKADTDSRSQTTLKYKTNKIDSSWQSGTDISSRYFTDNTEGNALKTLSAHSTARWVKVQVTANNTQSGSNYTAKGIGLVYKPKRPR